MSIVTKKGDRGSTYLLCGSRVSKDDPRVEACGDLDELCSFIGLARSTVRDKKVKGLLLAIQKDLFAVCYEFTAGAMAGRIAGERICAGHIRRLEGAIGALESGKSRRITAFCVPGDNRISGTLDVARTIARRAERRAATLGRKGLLKNEGVLIYLNRLSDLLFLLARSCEKRIHRR